MLLTETPIFWVTCIDNPFICSSFSWLKNLWRKKCGRNKVAASDEIRFNVEDYLESERCKEKLGDFTLSEYNEKGMLN